MSRSVRTLSGAKARRYFTDLLAAGPGVSEDAARRFAASLESEVLLVKVRPPRRAPAEPAPLLPFDSLPTSEPARAPDAEPPLGTVDSDDAPEAGVAAGEGSGEGAPFDPYAFSLVVVLTKDGAAGLMARLAEIDSAESLRSLAKAQHVSLPATLAGIADIRAAIVAGTERRIADRRAAAS